jgi:hypothetical protein
VGHERMLVSLFIWFKNVVDDLDIALIKVVLLLVKTFVLFSIYHILKMRGRDISRPYGHDD